MTAEQWLAQILLGGVMGIVGQGIRTTAGLKKTYDKAAIADTTFATQFQTSVFFMSLFTGFVAGALATFAASSADGTLKISKEVLLGIIAAGYAGTDFVEAFMKKYLPKQDLPQFETEPTKSGNGGDTLPAKG